MRRVGVLFALGLPWVLTVSTGWAGDGPAAPPAPVPGAPGTKSRDPLDVDLDLLHRLVGEQKWKAGADAATSLLATFKDDPRVLARLDEIEEDLRICTYRAQRKPLDGAAVLGRGVSKFDFSTRNADFAFDPATIASQSGSPGWTWAGNIAIFDVPFEGAVSVTMSIPKGVFMRFVRPVLYAAPLPACLLCFDTETRGGYTMSVTPIGPNECMYDVRITRVGGDAKEIGKPVEISLRVDDPIDLTFARSVTGLLTCSINGRKLTEAQDQRFTRGLLALAVDRELFGSVKALQLRGRVETMYARRIESEAEGLRYRKWLANGWKRESVLPAWVIEAEKRAPPPPLPSDATPEVRAKAEPLLPLVVLGEVVTDALRDVARKAPKRTAAYLFALASIADGDWAESDSYLKGLLGDERTFGPGWIALARSQMERGDMGGAQRTLAEAKVAAPAEPGIWDMIAAIELGEGRIDGAEKALDEAARAGSVTLWARELRRIFLRMKRGPQWQRRFDYESPHYVITGDTNLQTCMEVAKVLEEANASYKAKFRPHADGAKSRVFVFAGQESYLDYAGSLGTDLTNTLGVYMPKLRQLCVFLHEDRRTLWDTVRHEGFHQYLHQFVQDAPDWFNEGYAEYFGFVRKAGGKHVTGLVEKGEAAEVAACADEFTPLERFFVLNHREFMENAEIHYPQAWAVVHFLRETKDEALRGILDRYLDALIAGKSRAAAYQDVLAPLMPKIKSGFARHVEALKSK